MYEQKITTTIARELVSGLPDRGITMSIGVSNYRGTCDSSDIEVLYRQADMALYAAKDAGRNGVKDYKPKLEEMYRDRVEKKYKG